MTAYKSDKDVADGVASGATDFGVGGFTPAAFSYASRGFIKAIAGQAREKKSYEGNEILVSNAAFAQGLRKLEDLPSRSVGITEFGTPSHYQVGQIARAKKIKFDDIRVRPMHTLDALSKALGTGQVDAAILPGQYAREMLVAGQAKLLGWFSEFDEQQLGAVFAGAKTIAGRREVVEKFVRAYRRGAAEYTGALMRHDSVWQADVECALARSLDADRALCVSRPVDRHRGGHRRGQRLLHGPDGAARCRRHCAPGGMVQVARTARRERRRRQNRRSELHPAGKP